MVAAMAAAAARRLGVTAMWTQRRLISMASARSPAAARKAATLASTAASAMDATALGLLPPWVSVGLIPTMSASRPASAIPLQEVLAAFRSGDLETADGQTSPELATLLQELDEARRARVAGLTLADVLPRPDVVPLSARRGEG